MEQPENDPAATSFWRRPGGMALATAALIAGFYLLLLACPLMHLTHGHGHGGHGKHPQAPGRTHKDEE